MTKGNDISVGYRYITQKKKTVEISYLQNKINLDLHLLPYIKINIFRI